MSAKSQFLKKLQARQSSPGAFESKSQADIAAFRQGMALLQEQMAGWLEDTGISVQGTRKSLTDLLVGSRAFEVPGIVLCYENRAIRFTPSFLYGQGVTGCVEVTLCAEGTVIPLHRLFMRSGKTTDWTYRSSGQLSGTGGAFCEEVFFDIIGALLP